MSKVRVHELAKELGLENKAVLSLCEQLGIDGKLSHSNSLSDDDAEKIRRSVIRQAISGRKVVREIERQGGTLTERRMGNVIRRRKKADEPEQEEKKPTIDLSEPARKSQPEDTSHEGIVNRRRDALAAANALFKQADPEPDPTTSEEEREIIAKEPESAAMAAEIPEAAAVESSEGGTELQPESTGGAEEAGDRLSEVRKRHDVRIPKVLGKIDLPQQPEPPKKQAKSSAAVTAEPIVDGIVEEVPTRGGKAGKKKGSRQQEAEDSEESRQKRRRKQVLRRDDLLDYEGDFEARRQRRDKRGKKKGADVKKGAGDIAPTKASKRVVKIDSEISVGDFAKQMGIKASEVITQLMALGVMANINQLLDPETAAVVAAEFGFTVLNFGQTDDELTTILNKEDDPAELELRPPVVTVMGHVDHGKTSLLDRIRKASVVSGEAGGITQHIGAYSVMVPERGLVTFLDTPGHEAFTAMRGRGAQVTDIVVLVVAADDGVMPQTVEAINHAKAAEVPIIVAVNKIDKEGANPDQIKTQISEHGLVPEEWGGDTIIVHVSAKTGVGVDSLLENLQLQSEILELKANPNRPAIGTVIESRLDKQRGPVISVLVQNGTLKKGDFFIAGATSGKVRALIGDDGKQIDVVGPSIAAEVLGVDIPPLAGDDFYVMPSEADARRVAEVRSHIKRTKELASRGANGALTLENFSQMVSVGVLKELPIIIKADVQGSVEAVRESMEQLSDERMTVKVIHAGVGAVSENDVQLAVASKAVIVAFNIRADTRAAQIAEAEGIEIRYSRIIYEIVDSIKAALLGLLDPIKREETLGRAEVRLTFKVPRLGVIAGSYVLDGVIKRGSFVRLLRDNRVVYEGKLGSLRRFKDDVKEVAAGYECGIGIEGYTDVQNGDVLEIYQIIEEAPVQ